MRLQACKGMGSERRPTGLIRVDFHDGETFSWNPLVTTIQHLIVGSAYIDHYGTLHVRSSRSDLSAKVKFKEPWVGSPNHKVPPTPLPCTASAFPAWQRDLLRRLHLCTRIGDLAC